MNLSRNVLDYYALLLSGVSHCYSKDIHYFSHQEKDEVWFLSSSAEKQSICFFGLSFGSSSSEKEMSVFHFALQLEKRGDEQHGRQIICNTTQLCPPILENSILAWTFPWVFKETITHITSYYFPHMKKTQRAPTRPILTNLVRHRPPTVDGSQCQVPYCLTELSINLRKKPKSRQQYGSVAQDKDTRPQPTGCELPTMWPKESYSTSLILNILTGSMKVIYIVRSTVRI